MKDVRKFPDPAALSDFDGDGISYTKRTIISLFDTLILLNIDLWYRFNQEIHARGRWYYFRERHSWISRLVKVSCLLYPFAKYIKFSKYFHENISVLLFFTEIWICYNNQDVTRTIYTQYSHYICIESLTVDTLRKTSYVRK